MTTPIAGVRWRERCHVRGTVRAVRVRPWGDSPTLEVVLYDESGGITAVFLARRKVAGIRPGTVMSIEGVVGTHHRELAVLNPRYELESVPGV